MHELHDHFWIDADHLRLTQRLTHRRHRTPERPLSSPQERRLIAALFVAVAVVLALPKPATSSSSSASLSSAKLARVAVVLPR